MRADADHLGSPRFPTLAVAWGALCEISTAAQPGRIVDNNRFLIGLAGTASLGRPRHQALPALLAQSSLRGKPRSGEGKNRPVLANIVPRHESALYRPIPRFSGGRCR